MKRNSIKKKAEKRSKLDEIDPLDDLDVGQLELVARGRGWDTDPKEGKKRPRELINLKARERPHSRKRRVA